MKLYKNYKIHYFCKEWGVDGKFWTLARERGEGYQNQTSTSKEGGGPKFWSFFNIVITECLQKFEYWHLGNWYIKSTICKKYLYTEIKFWKK